MATSVHPFIDPKLGNYSTAAAIPLPHFQSNSANSFSHFVAAFTKNCCIIKRKRKSKPRWRHRGGNNQAWAVRTMPVLIAEGPSNIRRWDADGRAGKCHYLCNRVRKSRVAFPQTPRGAAAQEPLCQRFPRQQHSKHGTRNVSLPDPCVRVRRCQGHTVVVNKVTLVIIY